MSYQATFKRYELKYMLTRAQKQKLLEVMEPYMVLDQYGHSDIRNIYYDTDSFRLIRRSLEKPCYKEKLRLRSYGPAGAEDKVFVELKKKYRSVVYKRRLVMPLGEAAQFLASDGPAPNDSQIAAEIRYFRDFYSPLRPMVSLSYEREAFYMRDGSSFRVTFDENILYRDDCVHLDGATWGSPILRPGQILMELKTPGGLPLWMTHFLTREHIYKTSFSKYGNAYTQLLHQHKGGALYA